MQIKIILLFFVFLLSLLFKQTALGAVLILDNKQDQINPQAYLEWYKDETGKLKINELSGLKNKFNKFPSSNIYPRTNKPYWIHLILHSAYDNDQWLLELSYTQLDYIDFYSRTGNKPWRHISTGDKKPLSSKDVRHPRPVFKIELRKGVNTEIFLRIQSSTTILAPITLWKKNVFQTHTMNFILVNGLVFGVLLALIFYNLFLYPTVLDSTYLWFALYLGSLFLFQFSFDGFSSFYFWPNSPIIVDRIAMLSLWVSIATGLRFTQLIGHMEQYAPKINRLFYSVIVLCFILALIVALSGPAATIGLLPAIGLFSIIFIPFSLWKSWQAGYLPARFAFYAFFPQLPGAALMIARTLNWVDASFWSENLFIIGTAISAIFLSFALADRINTIRNENLETQSKLLKSERRASKAQQQLSHKLIKAQDNERKRIAADLHDGVGQNLSFLTNALKRLYRKEGISIPESINEAARDAVDEIRSISHQLHPHLLDKLGLVAAIEAIAERMQEQTGIQCIVSIEETGLELTENAELHIFRIAQEALSNVVRHSNASQVKLSLKQNDREIQFNVVDNGRCSIDKLDTPGLGLESINERAKLLGGKVIYNTVTPHGFKLTLTIPTRGTSA